MKYAIKHRAIKKYRKNKSANINCIVLSFAAFSICDFLSAWFEADPNQYNYTISEPVCQFINCITVMFFGTAKCKVNSRRLWSGEGRKVMPLCLPYNKPPKPWCETVSGVEVISTLLPDSEMPLWYAPKYIFCSFIPYIFRICISFVKFCSR